MFAIRLSDIFDGNECGKEELERKLSVITDKKFGLVKSLEKTLKFNDEPKLHHYVIALAGRQFSSGTALSDERARLKAVCEAIERFCLSKYDGKTSIISSYSKLEQALDPTSLAGVAPQDKKKFGNYDGNTKFAWVSGLSMTRNDKIWIPAQLVYVPYQSNEPVIRNTISTGAASGTSYSAAIYRGLCEVIERDAFMITYLNKLPRSVIDIASAKSEDVRRLDYIFRRYDLERYSFDITTDVGVPVILTILVDRSGVGPSVSLGMKCSFNVEEALLGSMEEAQQTRPWIRGEMHKFLQTGKMPPEQRHFLERAFFWYDVGMIKKLDFLLKTKNKIKISRIKSRNFKDSNERLRAVLRALRGYETDVVDLTDKKIGRAGFRVIKAIVPEMQPLHLVEGRRYLGGRRLYAVPRILGYRKRDSKYDDLNKTPHPFL